MGYTHHWTQKRAFTDDEWNLILGEAKRIIAKAARGHYYTGGKEDTSHNGVTLDEQGCSHGFEREEARRTFPHPEVPVPRRGEPILLAAPSGRGKPRLNKHLISFNGRRPLDYESFLLAKEPPPPLSKWPAADASSSFCKTELRPYDAVVVSILAVARTVAPDAIEVSSDGGDAAIRYLF